MTREEAIELLKEGKFKNVYSLYRGQVIKYRRDWNDASDIAIEALQADEVEVVRCKDCRYANECHKSVHYTRNESNSVLLGYLPIEWIKQATDKHKKTDREGSG